ncbi:MAG: LLM class F420-dependent oxidoreductase [Actinomycetota bacterium]|nr:LLM class F420-dependent oxidoreductase [Actinomycetota bacterium]MEE2957858.1 LLM class F420-dependent oxidoreductase [Actinomycetota bacterium]
MQLGITIHLTDRSIDVRELAVAVEERGFHSLYVPEHTHIPVERSTPPPTGGEVLDEDYARSPDPWVSLAAAAAVTDRIRLGAGVALVGQHHPISLAKAVASVDVLSAGRVVLGVGFGWNREEMAHHSVEYESRRDRVREHVAAMRALWTEDEAEFHGRFVDFEPSWSWPVPVQFGGPPVLVGGGAGPRLFAEVARWADGWMPIGGSGLRAGMDGLRAACDEVGRDFGHLTVAPFGVLPDDGKLEHYAVSGAAESVLRVPSAGRDEVLEVLDEYVRYLD